MTVLAEFSVIPVDQGQSISGPVAHCVQIVENSGLDYKLGPMGTTVEAPSASQALAVIDQCLQAVQKEAHRVEVIIKLDWREGDGHRLAANVESVQEKVGHPLKT